MKIIVFALVGLLLIAGGSLAQPVKDSPAPGRYQVVSFKAAISALGDMSLLVDTWSGKTWKLGVPTGSSETAWIPISRLDTPEQLKDWAKTHPAPPKK